ncbi:restriction endonuclease subunit S, partial [Psychrobacter aquimaris]|uniref:restriction endonuclease subunit S n=1 Tax=Psychrobacter aquimaris TaxID=292733 RepID=UPI003FD218D3
MSELSYMDKLLDEVEVEWKELGEVATLQRGRVMSRGYLNENPGKYPVYSSQTANNGKIGSIDTFDFEGEYVNWTTDGANAGTVFYRT